MKVNELKKSADDQPFSQTEGEAASDHINENDLRIAATDRSENRLQKIECSNEFYELVSQIDPDAADDPFYKISPQVIETRSQLRAELRQTFWLAASLILILTSIAFVTYY